MEKSVNKRIMPDVSVIIPTYNVKKYIRECLDSLVNQTWTNFEVICVDDGSDDGTCDIIREYTKKDSRINLVEMDHCGFAGVMRNEGLHRARGEYCLFLDSDDFFEPYMLEHSLKKIREDNADICMFDARMYYQMTGKTGVNRVVLKKEYLPETIPFEGKSFKYIFNISTGCPWVNLIKKKLIDESHIEYMALSRYNDLYFINLMLASAKRITILPEVLVNYRQIPTSLQANNTKTPWDWYLALKALKSKLIELGIYKDVELSFRNDAFGVAIYNLCSLKSADAFCQVYDRLKNELFKELGLENFTREECYSYNDKKYAIYEKIQQYTATEYLFYQMKEYETRTKKAEAECAWLYKSKTYKLGNAALWLPKKLKKKRK